MSVAAGRPDTKATAGAHQVRAWILLGSVAASPAAWSIQLVVSYAVASDACFPHRTPFLMSPPPGWGAESAWLTALNLVCLAVALGVGAGLSWRHWRRAGSEKPHDEESASAIRQERTRFIAVVGMLTGVAFSIAILFDTLEPHLVAACWRIAQ